MKKFKLLKADLRNKRKGNVVIFIFLFFGAIFMALPLYLAIINSLKPLEELWTFPPKFYVIEPTFRHFSDLFTLLQSSLVPFTKYLYNTVLITVGGTFFHVIFSSMCAYSLAKRKFKGGQVMFTMVVFSLMFNGAVTAIPNFLIVAGLGMLDTHWALIIPAIGSSLGLYLIKQFMDQVPDTLLEAADVDGAGEFRKFWSIMMPSVKPAWLTVIVFSVQALWNTGATTFIYREELKTLAYALGQLATGTIARAGVGAAVAVVMMIVPIIVFIITQSRVIETMASSGIKE